MIIDDIITDREAEPCATLIARFLRSKKRFKYLRQTRLRNTRSGVGEAENEFIRPAGGSDRDGSALRHGIECIHNEVQEHLVQHAF